MSENNTGAIIINAAKCISTVGSEVNSLLSNLFEHLQESLSDAEIIKVDGLTEGKEYDRQDKNGWLSIAGIYNYGLIPPGQKRKPRAFLAVQIELTEDKEIYKLGQSINSPLIHILFCGGEDGGWSFDDEFSLPPAPYKGDEIATWDINLVDHTLWEFIYDEDDVFDTGFAPYNRRFLGFK